MKLLYITLIIIISSMLSINIATASWDPYEIENIKLDVRANSDQAAKKKALNLAQSRAFKQLLHRLLPKPEANNAIKTLLSQYRGTKLSFLIADLRITDEKFGSGRYLANANVRFKPIEIYSLFADLNLSYAETFSPPLLVIVVQNDGNKPLLWSEANKLFNAIQESPPKQGLLPYIIPYGDIEDIDSLSINAITKTESLHFKNFKKIAKRYNSQQILIIWGTITPNQTQFRSYRIAPRTASQFPPMNYQIKHQKSHANALITYLNDLQEHWKHKNLIKSQQSNSIQVFSYPKNPTKLWTNIQQLKQVPIITNVQLLRLSIRQATISISYRSSLNQLQEALRNQNFQLEQRKSNQNWYIRRINNAKS